MIKVYADAQLVYAPLVEGYELMDLVVTTGVNKAGTAEIKMPPGHPAYNAFTSYVTVVTVYRHDVLLFRGRALYLTDDIYGCRTVTCEGERGFLRDTIEPASRAQAVTGTPEALFREFMMHYNADCDAAKRFVVGEVTVTDPNDYIRIEWEEARTMYDMIDKLVELCGGYVTFSDDAAGNRVINWYANIDRLSGQVIEFGENLLDYSRTGANTELATVIYPYGAKDEETEERVTIYGLPSVGNRYHIQDDDAVAMYGRIAAAVYWDDVTLPENLLKKARAYLATSKLLVTSLELTAVDLSVLDKSIDTFAVGDWVRVYSAPHGLDAEFMVRERTYHLLNPEEDKVVLGKDITTLTGLDVAGDKSAAAQTQRTAQNITRDYTAAIKKAETIISSVNTSGAYMTTDGLLLQWGVLSITPDASASYTTKALTFPYSYSAAPVVAASVIAANPSLRMAGVVSTSMTGAVLSAVAGGSSDVEVQWIAVGKGS